MREILFRGKRIDNGEWWYVVKGKVASDTTSLVKYNGEWFYIVNGKKVVIK